MGGLVLCRSKRGCVRRMIRQQKEPCQGLAPEPASRIKRPLPERESCNTRSIRQWVQSTLFYLEVDATGLGQAPRQPLGPETAAIHCHHIRAACMSYDGAMLCS